jgi:hypothetical protein
VNAVDNDILEGFSGTFLEKVTKSTEAVNVVDEVQGAVCQANRASGFFSHTCLILAGLDRRLQVQRRSHRLRPVWCSLTIERWDGSGGTSLQARGGSLRADAILQRGQAV